MKERLNFSPKPFKTGQAPLVLLWLANLAVLIAMAGSIYYWNELRTENFSAHQEIDALEEQQRESAGRHQQLIQDLETINVKAYRKRVLQFHKIQTAYETHWGRLLDDLGSILPEDVRIVSLAPVITETRGYEEEETIIKLTAEARTKEAQLAFIRTLQGQVSFRDVRFETEEYSRDGVAVFFEIHFTHRPGRS